MTTSAATINDHELVERPGDLASGLSTGSSSSSPSAGWVKNYQRTLLGLDVLAGMLAVLAGYLVRFGGDATMLQPYASMSLVFPLVWAAVIFCNRGYDARCLGSGPEEYQRIGRSFIQLIAVVALASYILKADISRGFVFTVVPAAFALDIALRFVLRKRMHRRRRSGQAMSSVIVVGCAARVAALTEDLRRDLHAGLRVVGASLPDADVSASDVAMLDRLGITVLGQLDDIRQLVQSTGANTVAVTSSAEIGPEKLRWIAWQLEGTDAELAVSPGLLDVAGTRISVRQAAGLPLLYVEAPRFTGPHRVLKGAFDRVLAATALLMLSPVLFGIWLTVRLTSSGPAFFVQTRIGRNGRPFRIVKFRSMYTDAEARLADLSGLNEASDGLLFKMRNDPRVTGVGRVLRRYSIDELPQLFNVLAGSMSMVGPRPPLPVEVASYGDDVRRRLLVKPGLTGLWQVSGRSDLSWEDSVRLDLRYVENWSLTTDLQLLWKTGRAVLGASGAY